MSKTNSRITRRRFVAGAGAIGLGAATGVLAAPRIVRAEGKITVLNWQGYGTDEAWAVEAFKKATGHRGGARLLQLRAGDDHQAAHQSGRV